MPKILIADDDPAIVDSLKLLLEDDDYQVDTASDGEGVEKALIRKPDLVLLDIWMPGVDGAEICKKIKSDPETRSIPVIMISAARNSDAAIKSCGADDYLAKPFEVDELLRKVGSSVRR